MRGLQTTILSLAAAAALALGSAGCVKHMLDHRIAVERRGWPAVETIGDYEVGRAALYSGLGNFEQLHRLAPSNPDALVLLADTWTVAAFGYIEDDWELATDAGDDELAEEHRTRARAAYTRGVFYGLEALDLKAQDFEVVRRNPATLRGWLKSFDRTDAAALLWTAAAWIGRGNVSKDIPELDIDLPIGAAMLQRAIELDDAVGDGLAHVWMGVWHARAAGPQLELARAEFERALDINKGRLLITQVLFARTYFCIKSDKAQYLRLLNEALHAGDPLPEHRLSNVIAQRRARRYLTDVRMADCGF